MLPHIVPFTFGEEKLNLHDTVSATCTITKGDTPIEIWWTFSDNIIKIERKISTNDGIFITRAGNKVSILTIESVNARHRGNYSCHAKNVGGISNYSATLAINGDLKF